MHLYIITFRRGFSKWKSEPRTRDRQHHVQKKTGQQSTKHYTENSRSSNTNPTKIRG